MGGPDKVVNIEGRVYGAKKGQQIVLYAKSGIWYVQPYGVKVFTTIGPDSKWANWTHLGTEYAALLVEPGYRPPLTTQTLPNVAGDVVLVATVKGAEGPSQLRKTVHFSGYEWNARATASERGGRLNTFEPANVWTDDNGALHLRVANSSGKWTCAEVSLTRSLGYGLYRFTVRETSHLEAAIALDMFTWDDSLIDPKHREMDIEISRWGDPLSKNAQYVVQPYYLPVNVARFSAPAGPLTHSFRWEPGKVSFRTVQDAKGSKQGRVVSEHVFTSGIPSPGEESVHLNLYIFGTAANLPRNENEVVIEKFEYLP